MPSGRPCFITAPASYICVVRQGRTRWFSRKRVSTSDRLPLALVYLTHRCGFSRALQQIRLAVTLEDLTVYVAQRADKERESVVRQLSAPVNGVKGKLGEMEETLAGFQRTMHLVLSEVDADRERSAAIAVRDHILLDE